MQGLYAAGRTVCDLTAANLTVFRAYSPRYNNELISLLRTEITNAEAMPGENNRAGRRRLIKAGLTSTKKIALKNWQKLKSYITMAWTKPEERSAMLRTAGANLYTKASGSAQWALALEMLQSGAAFIEEQKKVLLESHVMPDDFIARYSEATNEYNNQWSGYSNMTGGNEIESNAKREANNQVYEKIIQICKDGQLIFSKAPTMQKRFAFSQVIRQLGYGGTAGMTVTITYGTNKLPVPDVDAVSTDLKYATIGNTKGTLKINRMAEGEHTFTFSAEGFQDLVATITLQAGVKSRFEFTMLEEVKQARQDTQANKSVAAAA
jgi:hypothetical protein